MVNPWWKFCENIQGVTERLSLNILLITRATINFRRQTISHFFTVARTFGYLFFRNQSWFFINFNNTKLLNAWYWRCKKRPLWTFEVSCKSAPEPPNLDSFLFSHTRQLIWGFRQKKKAKNVIFEPIITKIRPFLG